MMPKILSWDGWTKKEGSERLLTPGNKLHLLQHRDWGRERESLGAKNFQFTNQIRKIIITSSTPKVTMSRNNHRRRRRRRSRWAPSPQLNKSNTRRRRSQGSSWRGTVYFCNTKRSQWVSQKTATALLSKGPLRHRRQGLENWRQLLRKVSLQDQSNGRSYCKRLLLRRRITTTTAPMQTKSPIDPSVINPSIPPAAA